jgi:MoaA/NifB/PqqE/SkfB family radical SAM enzyme
MSNLNYHNTGKSIFDEQMNDDSIFAEYRRQWAENPKSNIVSNFPLHLDIESTNACNLKCPYCASSSNSWGESKKGFIDFDLFKRIIDEAAENGCCCVKFSLRGEPLLHPKLPEMIKYTMNSGIIDCYFNTNGMLLTDDMISKIIDSGLPRLSISIDGWDKASFEKNRLGADYNIVVKNIENLLEIRNMSNFSFPKVRVQTLMLPEMKDHWDDYKDFWKDYVDEIGYLDARAEGKDINHCGIINSKFTCPFLWQRMTILWDGTLLPCLMHGVDDFSLMSFGSVKNISIKEAWHSKKENYYRKLHTNGKSHEIEACDRCSYRALEIKKCMQGV